MKCEDFDTLRDPYLDRELDGATVAQIDAHLLLCATCGVVDQEARGLRDELRTTARRYRAPPQLRERIRRAIAPRPRAFANLRHLATGWSPIAVAASLMLTIALSSGITADYLGGASDNRVVDDVIASHIRSLMADHLIDVASSDRHTVKPWFNGKLDVSPPAVDLAASGFPLLGGRLDYVDERPCAALVYRHDKHVINVLVWAHEGANTPATESYSRQGYNLIHVAGDALDYWVVSDLNRGELNEFTTRLFVAARDSDNPG
ncbi:MAG TPA: anti-sigma factor [Stellaceae bacterium]|jgi:anti-sigma factor RsiW